MSILDLLKNNQSNRPSSLLSTKLHFLWSSFSTHPSATQTFFLCLNFYLSILKSQNLLFQCIPFSLVTNVGLPDLYHCDGTSFVLNIVANVSQCASSLQTSSKLRASSPTTSKNIACEPNLQWATTTPFKHPLANDEPRAKMKQTRVAPSSTFVEVDTSTIVSHHESGAKTQPTRVVQPSTFDWSWRKHHC